MADTNNPDETDEQRRERMIDAVIDFAALVQPDLYESAIEIAKG
jgi:hypothetical protein